MNLPNTITLSRLLVTAASFTCLELSGDVTRPDTTLVWWAFWLFLFAAITDFVDGWIARRLGEVTAFGRIADPFADKVLVCGALVILLKFPAARGIMDTWVVVVIITREFLVTTLRGFAESQGMAFPAERLGKIKMVAQCFLAASLMTVLTGTETFRWVAVAALWITLVLTIASACQYVWRARPLLKT